MGREEGQDNGYILLIRRAFILIDQLLCNHPGYIRNPVSFITSFFQSYLDQIRFARIDIQFARIDNIKPGAVFPLKPNSILRKGSLSEKEEALSIYQASLASAQLELAHWRADKLVADRLAFPDKDPQLLAK